jgi:hypothetical protein
MPPLTAAMCRCLCNIECIARISTPLPRFSLKNIFPSLKLIWASLKIGSLKLACLSPKIAGPSPKVVALAEDHAIAESLLIGRGIASFHIIPCCGTETEHMHI